MLLICGTDAPLYHYPIVTTTMVVVNVLIHAVIVTLGLDATPYYLAFGDGLHPIQWLTHNFLHANAVHLIGNMLYLFPFGLVVEGKIGWLRMLALYLAVCIGQGLSQQLIMLPTDPGTHAERLVELFDSPESPLDEEQKEALKKQWRQDLLSGGASSLGASAAIFGLLAICAIWAPVNEFELLFRWSLTWSAPGGGLREWSIATVCGIFVAQEAGIFWLLGMPLSSAALHLNGFIIGGAIGLIMLIAGVVDCEGYDLISVWSGEHFKGARMVQEDRRQRQAEIEEGKPQGPPRAEVPRLAHQISATRPTQSNILPAPAAPPNRPPGTAAAPPIKPKLISEQVVLPEFDDGIVVVDPIQEATVRIESMIALANYPAAVRELAETRKKHRGFVVSAASMGRLAEGLLAAKHIHPALTVLSIGCEAYPAFAPRWRIRIATIHLSVNPDPIEAIKQLKMVDKEMLNSDLRAHYVRVAQKAKQMAIEGSS